VLCAEGWHVCNPGDAEVLQSVSYSDANAFVGCFAYDAADDNNQCLPCNGDGATDDMAGMGQDCGYHAPGAASCIGGGRIDSVCCGDYASGTACQFKPGLTTGAVCCKGAVATTSTTSTTVATSSTLPVTTTTTTTSTSSTSTSTLPPTCTTSADCDDGDPCNGGETCTNGTCLVARADASPVCTGADALAVVTRFDAGAVTLVNTRTRAIDSTIAVGDSPWGVAWAHDGARIYVTNRKGDSVSVVDTASRAVIATIPVGKTPLGIAVHPFLPRAYVTSYTGDRVDVIDTTTLAVVDQIKVGDGPSGLAIHPAGAQLFVANYIGGTVSVVDLATNTVDATVATPALPVGIAIHPGGTKAYVACLKGREIAVIGTVSRSLLRTIRVGRKPIGVAFDDAGTRAYVTNSGDDTVTVLDAGTDTAIAKRPVGEFPIGVAVAGDGTVWVAGSEDDSLDVLGESDATSVAVPDTPVAIGDFIGTPPSDCPAAPLPCDDANPFTGDACRPDAGCVRDEITGFAAVKVGTDTIAALVEQADPADPLVARLRDRLGALQSAVEAAGTGGDRAAVKLVRKSLQPILKELEAARKRGTLGQDGARLLDVARETKRQIKSLGKGGRT
jgi:YVTN family beta-propeller protein